MDTNTLGIINTIGFSSMVMGFLYVGRKLQILDDLKQAIGVIKHNLKVVTDHLTAVDANFDHKELKAYSPFGLTREGRDRIREVGFDKVLRDHAQVFMGHIGSGRPELRYDVEKAAISAVYTLIDDPVMKPIKVYLYNHPHRDISNLAPTIGVYLRDHYLTEHPEIVQ